MAVTGLNFRSCSSRVVNVVLLSRPYAYSRGLPCLLRIVLQDMPRKADAQARSRLAAGANASDGSGESLEHEQGFAASDSEEQGASKSRLTDI